MPVGLLTDAQLVAFKAVRRLAWTRSFTIRTYPTQETTDLYDDPAGAPTDVVALGDWAWKPQNSYKGSPGGEISDADLYLCCDIAHQAALQHERARILVDGMLMAIRRITPAEAYGEIVIEAIRE